MEKLKRDTPANVGCVLFDVAKNYNTIWKLNRSLILVRVFKPTESRSQPERVSAWYLECTSKRALTNRRRLIQGFEVTAEI
ncbi:hypothetical protein P363_0120945 [Paenibacillus sp. MAEPY1]|nr:hypothetical protein P363_0120945 [Paenibacillus sp. MAEPY1]